MGAYGPDKGVRYLMEAWKKLNYSDATLVLAGRGSETAGRWLYERFCGKGQVQIRGWVDYISSFYEDISLFICPAATEGFNIEVLEAMAHGRPVICSNAAGAADVVGNLWTIPGRDSNVLADAIDWVKKVGYEGLTACGTGAREEASKYTWDKIRKQYVKLWKSMLTVAVGDGSR
jgi:glycosyltransferase involved in cell wall biosynthesis